MDTRGSDLRRNDTSLRSGGMPALLAVALLAIATACGPGEEMERAALGTPSSDAEVAAQDEGMSAIGREVAPDTLLDSGLDGTGDESEVNGRVMVLWRSAEEPLELLVEAEGLQAGDHAWDVHAGSCTAPGPVALALSETETTEGVVGPLLVDQTGIVELVVEIPELAGMVPSDGRYTLHVHDAAGIVHSTDGETPVTVACARL